MTGKLLLTLRGHENEVMARAEGPDGKLLSVETDGTLKRWSLEQSPPVRIGTAARNEVGWAMSALSADGGSVARVHVEKVEMKDEYASIVEVWDTAGKTPAKVFRKVGGGQRGIRSYQFTNASDTSVVALSADGRRMALLRPAEFPPRAGNQKIDPANPPLAVAPADLTVWDVASGKEIYSTAIADPPGTAPSYDLATFTTDGTTVSICQHSQSGKNTLRMFEIANRREKPALDLVGNVSGFATFSPDGRLLAAVEWKGEKPAGRAELAVYELATGARKTLDVRMSPGAILTWSPDSKRLLVPLNGVNERKLNVYDVATGKLTASLYTGDQVGRRMEIRRLWDATASPVFSPDGKRIAGVTSTRQSDVIKVWDAESGKDLLTIPFTAQRPGEINCLAFTPGNHKLLSVSMQPPWGGGLGPTDTTPPIIVTTYDATPRSEPAK
jgi:WD40 repeat protein